MAKVLPCSFASVFTGYVSRPPQLCSLSSRASLLLYRAGGKSVSLSFPRSVSTSAFQVFAKSGSRFALYNDSQDYVLIEPGQDEVFVDLEELQSKLRGWLERWPSSSLPDDLAKFSSLDEAVTYLVNSACELEISDGSGVVQWFEVRL